MVIEGNADAYVTFNGGYAFNGGFFITTSSIEAAYLSVYVDGKILDDAEVKVSGKTIKVITGQTGINNLHAENSDAKAVYDLNGRRTVAPHKGIYIIDGVKTIVK